MQQILAPELDSSASRQPSSSGSPGRIASIDVFRGLTILTMVFVNEIHYFKGVPGWMKHKPVGVDGMTFVDMVFPAFLFIVGMAIPFALLRRRESGESFPRTVTHLLGRTVALLVIGVYMCNMRSFDEKIVGISNAAWTLLAYLGIVLVWNVYPRWGTAAGWLFRTLRVAGAGLLVWLALAHGAGQGLSVWISPQWWGIVGLIGWSYLIASLAYLVFRSDRAAMVGVLGLLVLLFAGDRSGALKSLGSPDSIWSIHHWFSDIGAMLGTHTALTVAGILLSMVLMDTRLAPAAKARWMAVFAAMLWLAGMMLRPLYGIYKNGGSPTWALYSASLCCLLYLLLWWLVDVRRGIDSRSVSRFSGWSFLRLAGANPLFAYILPGIIHSALDTAGITFLRTHLNEDGLGILRGLVLSVMVVTVAGLCNRWKVLRLQA
jgi:heparan-alpha-glucosaminide N-acetyltransferase